MNITRVDTVCIAKTSWDGDVIKFAAVPIAERPYASSRPREFVLPSRTWQVRTTKYASPNLADLVLRKAQYFWQVSVGALESERDQLPHFPFSNIIIIIF